MLCFQNPLQSSSWTSVALAVSSCCSLLLILSRTGAPITSGQALTLQTNPKWFYTTCWLWRGCSTPHEVSVAVINCSVDTVCFQTGPSALAGVKSSSHHHHPVGGSVEAHEVRDQGAAQWAPAPPHRTHLEAQLCGKSHHVGANGTIS